MSSRSLESYTPKTLGDLMTEKHRIFTSINENSSILEVFEEMAKSNKPMAVLISNNNHQPIGMVSSINVINKLHELATRKGKKGKEWLHEAERLKISDLTMEEMVVADSSMSVEQAIKLM